MQGYNRYFVDFKFGSETIRSSIIVHSLVRYVTALRLLSYRKTPYIVYKSSGGKIGNSSRGRGVPPFRVGRTWFKLAVTSSNQFLPVVVHDK